MSNKQRFLKLQDVCRMFSHFLASGRGTFLPFIFLFLLHFIREVLLFALILMMAEWSDGNEVEDKNPIYFVNITYSDKQRVKKHSISIKRSML